MDLSRQHKFLEQYGPIPNSIFSKHILIIGAGGVGSVLSELLVRGGFTSIDIVDFDVVDQSNLQRQTFIKKDIGILKVKALQKRLISINPNASISVFAEHCDFSFLDQHPKTYDLILDASDNFETRFEINSFCKKNNIPWFYSGAIKGEIMCGLFNGKTSQFETLFSKDTPNQDCSFGVLASSTFCCASIVYTEVLKYYVLGSKYVPHLIKYNLWNQEFFKIPLKK
jgi:adenylyltransferase/sulfurtransferase